ncbi:MAG: 1-deoxy-D-xylulose-5-phosphate reductoisomerase [Desulfovibrio sp.]|nr:1-deoxy-D-xylulose-5-phosphate reductoisomerase [Desulfovibrio sp.]
MAELWPGLEGSHVSYISPPPSKDWQTKAQRNLVILGSTGSIGRNSLAVVAKFPERFRIVGLSCATNVAVLAEQARLFRPPSLAVADAQAAERLELLLPKDYHPKIFVGQEGYAALARVPDGDTVLSAQTGAAGLSGTLSAACAGRVLCLANKESLVLAGSLLRAICAKTHAALLPIDSEHNALFQCLAGRGQEIASLVLTASGGPFRSMDPKEFDRVTPSQALHHPTWSMGKKISIDSATMMNKGLEVIEAAHLYGVDGDAIEICIHPQSVIHSMVRLCDGSVLAQLGIPDMQLPIAYCLAWPNRLPHILAPVDFAQLAQLTFEAPDPARYPCLFLAKEALRRGDGACIVLNAANEWAVSRFLEGGCLFTDIARCVQKALEEDFSDEDLATFVQSIDDADDLDAHVRRAYAAIMRLDAQTRAFVTSFLA